MLLNILILFFLVLMVVIWAHYGLFSALLHLLAVLGAGAIAFALWEPLAFAVQFSRPNTLGIEYAWGFWLLALFVLALLLIRVVMDKIVRGNVQFNYLTNVIGGGAIGLVAGMLTAGVAFLGVSFLPLDEQIMGHRALQIEPDGSVTENRLWVPVDRLAANIFSGLSGGAFYSGRPMRQYLPDLVLQAALFRTRVDPHASVTAVPDAVALEGYYLYTRALGDLDLDPRILSAVRQSQPDSGAAPKLVIVDTNVKVAHQPPFDKDGLLRLPPSQVRLAARVGSREDGRATLHAPIAVVDEGVYMPFDDPGRDTTSALAPKVFRWVFLVPQDVEPMYVTFRRLRLRLGEAAPATPEAIRLALGVPQPDAAVTEAPPPPTGTATGPQFTTRDGRRVGAAPRDLVVTRDLPAPISKNMTSGLVFTGQDIMSGVNDVNPTSGRITQEMHVGSFYMAAEFQPVRLAMDRELVHSTWGRVLSRAAALGGAVLEDDEGVAYDPYAWVLSRQDRSQFIYRREPIRSASLLPLDRMNEGDVLYLYYQIPPGKRVTGMRVGSTEFPLDMPLELR